MATKLERSTLDEAVKRLHLMKKTEYYVPWIILDFCIAGLLYIDISHGSVSRVSSLLPLWLWYLEFSFLIIYIINMFYNVLQYTFPAFARKPIALTVQQTKLLGIVDSDPGFISDERSEEDEKNNKSSSVDVSDVINSFCLSQSSVLLSPSASSLNMSAAYNARSESSYTDSPNLSLTSSSWTYHDSNRSYPQQNMSVNSSTPIDVDLHARQRTFASKSKLNKSIADEKSLSRYLKEYEEKEQNSFLRDSSSFEGLGSSLWNYNRSPVDFTSQLSKYQYQMASKSPQSRKAHKDDNDSPTKYCNDEVWKKFGVTPEVLDSWTENLRKWIAQTIITSVVTEINNINKVLGNTLSRNISIGEVSISTLGQIAFTNSGQIPHLNTLLPFLDVTSNQVYLVHRLKTLASGGCISAFKWNGGGTFKQKPWDEHLPTDSMIIMHLFCSYLDARTPFHPNYPDGRSFMCQHFVKTPDKPDTSKVDCLYIYQAQINPPIYKLVTKEVTYELPEGRNNMFQVILLFLYHVKKYYKGMLGRLNFDSSGVNTLWILDS